eukprot:SAG22_NODE_2135_length_2957_cov_2.637859_4_plen_141_part_00
MRPADDASNRPGTFCPTVSSSRSKVPAPVSVLDHPQEMDDKCRAFVPESELEEFHLIAQVRPEGRQAGRQAGRQRKSLQRMQTLWGHQPLCLPAGRGGGRGASDCSGPCLLFHLTACGLDQPPTANRQPPTANRQPPTAN